MKINQTYKFSEFFDRIAKKRRINFIILHHIQANSLLGAIKELKKHGVSSHFIIDEKGEIFSLVDEKDIAYHAGVSFWKGIDGLNQTSIGIEFFNKNPFEKKFTKKQMQEGLKLCKLLMKKHKIKKENVIGHSDIAYDKNNNLLNRKQDPSHLFDWKFLAKNGVGIFPEEKKSRALQVFCFGDKDLQIKLIKKKLKQVGYRVLNLNDEFDAEMQNLSLVFNRKFLGKEIDFWTKKSTAILQKI